MTAPKKAAADAVVEDTFKFTLPEGSVATVGRPRGVLKLKMRDILSAELLKDPEIVGIATAFLSIRDIGGFPVVVRTYADFSALMNRFGSDETLNDFMNDYHAFIDPAAAEIVAEVTQQAVDEHLSVDEMNERFTDRLMAHQLAKRNKGKA